MSQSKYKYTITIPNLHQKSEYKNINDALDSIKTLMPCKLIFEAVEIE